MQPVRRWDFVSRAVTKSIPCATTATAMFPIQTRRVEIMINEYEMIENDIDFWIESKYREPEQIDLFDCD